MNKEKSVIEYYVLCNKLKDVVRTGWINWKVNRERVESIAEHIYGTQMLALSMYSEFNYDIDITKVVNMLSIHELGETIIGDLTEFQISKEEKIKKEHEAVHKILGNLLDGKRIEELFLEFDNQETEEAKFAFQCDKLECDIQCKLYDEENCVDIYNQQDNDTISKDEIDYMIKNNKTWSENWIEYDQSKKMYDDNFMSVSNYILNNKIR